MNLKNLALGQTIILGEGFSGETKKIGNEFKTAINRVADLPIDIDGFAYSGGEFLVLYDTPRYIRKEEYEDNDPEVEEWQEAEEKVWDVIEKFNKKYRNKYRFGSAGNISGSGVVKF